MALKSSSLGPNAKISWGTSPRPSNGSKTLETLSNNDGPNNLYDLTIA